MNRRERISEVRAHSNIVLLNAADCDKMAMGMGVATLFIDAIERGGYDVEYRKKCGELAVCEVGGDDFVCNPCIAREN